MKRNDKDIRRNLSGGNAGCTNICVMSQQFLAKIERTGLYKVLITIGKKFQTVNIEFLLKSS
jgi:hypothetical protein